MGEVSYMSMTEVEMSTRLGLITDPDKNRVNCDFYDLLDMNATMIAIQEGKLQKQTIGTVNAELWLEFLPWYSLN
jgi:hypothetical protein